MSDKIEDRAARLSLIRMTRATAVGITVLIAALSFCPIVRILGRPSCSHCMAG